jgi:hypothetical protein
MPLSGFRLVALAGPYKGRSFAAKPGQTDFTIGRKKDRDCCLEQDDFVSREHAVITSSSRGYLLTDLDSMNGTAHKGKPVSPRTPVPLRDGDQLEFGSDTVMRFELLPEEAVPDQDTPSKYKGPRRRPGAAPPAPPPPPRPSRRPTEEFGDYAVYDLLNESDTDRVDHALLKDSETPVALKRFTTKLLTRAARRRIAEEVERARRWQHPNIAAILGHGDERGTLYVASRFVDGVTVAKLHGNYATDVDAALAAYVIRDAAAALAYAQTAASGFVYRYLSPRGMMVGRNGDVVLINFGIAPVKLLLGIGSLTEMESRCLAPECLAEKPFDARADIFSLGVILYELLTREPIDPKQAAVLPPVDMVRPETPAELTALTTRATSLNPRNRFRSAAEMAEALVSALDSISPGYGAKNAVDWMAKHAPGA